MTQSATAPVPSSAAEDVVGTTPVNTGGNQAEEGNLESEKPEKTTEKRELTAAEEDEAGKVYPPAAQTALVMAGLYLSLFLVSLVSGSPNSS